MSTPTIDDVVDIDCDVELEFIDLHAFDDRLEKYLVPSFEHCKFLCLIPYVRRRLVEWDRLAPWQQDNPAIRSLYRPPCTMRECLWSLLYIHNETANIYSHLIGVVAFVAFIILFSIFDVPVVVASGAPHSTIFIGSMYVCYISSLCMLLFSTLLHIFWCSSSRVCSVCCKLDYAGISLVVLGCAVPVSVMMFRCTLSLAAVWIAVITVMVTSTIVTSSLDFFQTPRFRPARALVFFALGCSGVGACAHALLNTPCAVPATTTSTGTSHPLASTAAMVGAVRSPVPSTRSASVLGYATLPPPLPLQTPSPAIFLAPSSPPIAVDDAEEADGLWVASAEHLGGGDESAVAAVVSDDLVGAISSHLLSSHTSSPSHAAYAHPHPSAVGPAHPGHTHPSSRSMSSPAHSYSGLASPSTSFPSHRAHSEAARARREGARAAVGGRSSPHSPAHLLQPLALPSHSLPTLPTAPSDLAASTAAYCAARDAVVQQLLVMCLSYTVGAVFFSSRMPERWFVGGCDIFPQSHTIFHLFVLFAAVQNAWNMRRLLYATLVAPPCP